ncbi:DUF4097 family beta strand repeat-containing protein [Niallia oryzisoli]|uniref:DUF4097 family beta strand repeat-containing protein n=1 Tax=Niallia oryzisoli TaxID=1737571 RepID=A0ABZ2CCK4_9BACI
MPNMKKISIVALFLLLVGITGSLLTFHTKNQNASIKEERVFNNESITGFNIKADNAEVEMIPVNHSQTRVTLTGGSQKNKEYDFEADVQGKTLYVSLNEKQLKYYNFDFSNSALSIKVYVPEKLYDNLQVELANGNVYAEGLEIKEAAVNTINGTVDLNRLETSKVIVESDNGEIFLEDIEGDISGEVMNGLITLKTNHLDRNIDLESKNGAIDIVTEKEPTNAIINADATHGAVDIFDDLKSASVFGKGENQITLTTLNGKITVSKVD